MGIRLDAGVREAEASMTSSPETFELDIGEAPQPPAPGSPPRFRRWPVLVLGAVGLLALVRSHEPHPKPQADPLPDTVDALALEGVAEIDTAPEDTAEEIPQAVSTGGGGTDPWSPPTVETLVMPPPELPGTPTPPPAPEVVTDALEDTQEVLQNRAVLLARNAKAAEDMANENIAKNASNDPRLFEKFAAMRDTARSLGSFARQMDNVDVQANPYQAVSLVIDALERIETQNMLRDNERAKLNNVAAMLGELGQSIVDNRDEDRYPLARRALVAANRWQGRSDGHGEYEAALTELDQRAVRAIARARATHSSTDAIAMWAPKGATVSQAQASTN